MDLGNKKTRIIIGAVTLGLGALIYFLFKNKPLGVELLKIHPTKNNFGKDVKSLDLNMVLEQGSEGLEVAELQKKLVKKYGQNIGAFGEKQDGVDGIFGRLTLAGLLKAKRVSKIALKDL